MCGRFTVKATWAELVALYRLTLDRPSHNLQPRYNICPTDPIDVVTERDGKRDFVPMRWGLMPCGGRSRSRNCTRRRSMHAPRQSLTSRSSATPSNARAA
jgi:putative SOS response-associated peptidase YedK